MIKCPMLFQEKGSMVEVNNTRSDAVNLEKMAEDGDQGPWPITTTEPTYGLSSKAG